MRMFKAIMLLMIFSINTAHALSIQIFTVSNKPVITVGIPDNIDYQYFNLDQIRHFIDQTNQLINDDDPSEAKVFVTNIMKKKHKEIAHAVQGIKLAQNYHITNIPAIIFDHGCYEVIGQTNLLKAIQEYKSWLEK